MRFAPYSDLIYLPFFIYFLHFGAQEYNIYGWWVGELNGIVGIVPKDFLHPAYIL